MPFFANLTNGLILNINQYSSILLLVIAELSCHFLLNFFFSGINILLIIKTSMIHPNLKFVLLTQSFCILARSITRSIILLIMLSTDNLTWNPTHELIFIFSYFAYFRNVIAHVLVIERLNATLSFKNYEGIRTPYFTISWLLTVNLITFGTVYGTSATSSTTFINLCFWAIMFILAVIELIGIMFLKKYNDKIYTNSSFVNATLSERYQLAENIRTTKQLFPILAIHFFNIALGTSVNWAIYYSFFGPINSSSIFTYALFNQIYLLIISFTSFLIELTMILCHPYLKRNFLNLFLKIRSRFRCLLIFKLINNNQITPASITNNINTIENYKKRAVSLTSVQGMELFNNNDNQTEEYFTYLELIWARKKSIN
ncbi:hypothetical protein Mgra_00008215, partial [Meloidogyne graminicola]